VIAANLPHRAALGRLAWCVFAAVAVLLAIAIFVVVGPTIAHSYGFDGRAYWGFPRDPLYAGPGTANGYGIYRYSPAFVPLMALWTAIPWNVWVVAWGVFLFGVYLWMAGRRNWLPLLAFPPFLFEIYMGNVHLLLAAAVVLGFRWPATWSFVLLTKVTPGVGLLWFAVRREWRSLAMAIGATLAIVAVGFAIAPNQWLDWIRSLAQTEPSVGPNVIPIPLLPRMVLAAALVTWGARTNRRWTVVVAATLAVPTLWSHSLAMLAGVFALSRDLPESIHVPSWLRFRRFAERPQQDPTAQPA
jgi:hypothetical protein